MKEITILLVCYTNFVFWQQCNTVAVHEKSIFCKFLRENWVVYEAASGAFFYPSEHRKNLLAARLVGAGRNFCSCLLVDALEPRRAHGRASRCR